MYDLWDRKIQIRTLRWEGSGEALPVENGERVILKNDASPAGDRWRTVTQRRSNSWIALTIMPPTKSQTHERVVMNSGGRSLRNDALPAGDWRTTTHYQLETGDELRRITSWRLVTNYDASPAGDWWRTTHHQPETGDELRTTNNTLRYYKACILLS